jgi:hypothetical protein
MISPTAIGLRLCVIVEDGTPGFSPDNLQSHLSRTVALNLKQLGNGDVCVGLMVSRAAKRAAAKPPAG